jgi:hypothetical protein
MYKIKVKKKGGGYYLVKCSDTVVTYKIIENLRDLPDTEIVLLTEPDGRKSTFETLPF